MNLFEICSVRIADETPPASCSDSWVQNTALSFQKEQLVHADVDGRLASPATTDNPIARLG